MLGWNMVFQLYSFGRWVELKDDYMDSTQRGCVSLAKLKLCFPEFPFLHSFRLVYAKGEICTRSGRQNEAVDRRSVLGSCCSPHAFCWFAGSWGWHGAVVRLPATLDPTTSPPLVSDSWARCMLISVKKEPTSPVSHLHHQRWSPRGNEGLMYVLAHPVGSSTPPWVLFCPCSPLFHTHLSSQLTILLFQALPIYTEVIHTV